MSSATDLYHVLGVGKGATEDDIRRAFRRIAAANHPDTHPGDETAAARFMEANAAHQILGDETKRATYDAGAAADAAGTGARVEHDAASAREAMRGAYDLGLFQGVADATRASGRRYSAPDVRTKLGELRRAARVAAPAGAPTHSTPEAYLRAAEERGRQDGLAVGRALEADANPWGRGAPEPVRSAFRDLMGQPAGSSAWGAREWSGFAPPSRKPGDDGTG